MKHLLKYLANPAEQALQAVDDADTRWSKRDRINAGTVKHRQIARIFSADVPRGREGSPLPVTWSSTVRS